MAGVEMKGKLYLVIGGNRSGKSEFAEKLASNIGGRVTYIATASPGDKEMEERIRLHRGRRPERWETVEETTEINKYLQMGKQGDVYLIDCLTIWITNLLINKKKQNEMYFDDHKKKEILVRVENLAGMVEKGINVIVVSSEVGLGIVPDNPLGRTFRDLTGTANQILAKAADKAYLVVAGIPLELK